MWQKKRGLKKRYRGKIKKYGIKGRTLDSWLYYLGYAEDIFISYTHNYSSKPSMIVTSSLKLG